MKVQFAFTSVVEHAFWLHYKMSGVQCVHKYLLAGITWPLILLERFSAIGMYTKLMWISHSNYGVSQYLKSYVVHVRYSEIALVCAVHPMKEYGVWRYNCTHF
jgi:hypothetical protein